MAYELYRPAAVEYARACIHGEVVLASPIRLRVISYAGCAAALGFLLFAFVFSYARKETAPGWLVPEAGQIRIYARQGGTVERVIAREGAVV
ncbi:MAG TPA: hypothetical protein VEU94_09480, partial [Terriglobales bacterium]|nr:hypothetical protein [Terriglobales bacterium]